ncbi:MAG: hypothetical protein HY905_03705 [Deltaproteobacteria bacterium]|nr:hypothetical protein [Deltaproteobacteria bacterium]
MRVWNLLAGIVVPVLALLAGGCGASSSDECHPACGAGFTCYYGVCVPGGNTDGGDGVVEGGDADAAADGDADAEIGADGDADTGADGDADADAGCSSGDARCSGDRTALETCSAGGAWESTPCTLGCAGDPVAHCQDWDISNIPDETLLSAGVEGTESWATPDENPYYLQFNTADGAVALYDESWSPVLQVRESGIGPDERSGIQFTVLTQPGGAPELGVFSFQRLDVARNVTVAAWGPRALVLLSEEDATIEGGVFVGCYGNDQPPVAGGREGGVGPGAGGGAGPSIPDVSGFRDGGGGGGGFGGSGGLGGGYLETMRGAAGTPAGTPELVPLEAGSGGGSGGGSTPEGRRGGTSGGSTQIVSGGTLTVRGWVDARGCGGLSTYGGANEGGGGGGSGGGILFEAPHVQVTGAITANGGGGGAGGEGVPGYSDGSPGEMRVVDPAPGGTQVTGYACDGGSGSGGAGVAGGGAPECSGDADLYNAGGGGGSAGRIRINGLTRNITGVLSPALGSPAASEGELHLR